jgi:fucose permease
MIAGGAILPLVYGKLADTIGAQSAYGLLIPLYLYIAYYATWGHKKLIGRTIDSVSKLF